MTASSTIKIFLNEPDLYAGIVFKDIDPRFEIFTYEDQIPHDDIVAVLVGLKDVITDEFIKPFPNLKYIVSNTTGVDHIKTTRPIRIINLDSREIQNVSATAEFTLTLLLSLVRKIPFIDPQSPADRIAYRGMQLNGKKLGIFGFGRLGKWMSKYAEALNMSWQSFDKNDSQEKKTEILETSDVITVHLPLREETIDFFGTSEFLQMRKQPYLINTSRPQIINKAALINALETGQITGAAMDFINYDASFNWDPELKLLTKKNLLTTPHIAGNTYDSIEYTSMCVISKLIKCINE